jgi:hypothetical protein
MPSRPASRAQARESSQPHKKTAKDSAARAATVQDSRCLHAAEHREFALSIEAARRSLADTFRRHGFDSAELDARLIIGHALALDHTALAAQARRALATAEAAAIDALARRRLAHEPVARILGRKEFWGLSFKLTLNLVPRPETETGSRQRRASPATMQLRERFASPISAPARVRFSWRSSPS